MVFALLLFLTAPFEVGGKRPSDLLSPKRLKEKRPRQLRFRAMFNEYQVGYFNQLAKEFEKLHPDVDVVIERVTGGSWTDFEVALLNDFWGRNPPDCARISEGTLMRLINADMLETAPPDIAQGLKELLYSDDLKKALYRGDKVYGTIHGADWQGIYYNKDHFKEVGLDPEKPPATWDELLYDAGKLTKWDANGKVIRAGISLRKEAYLPGIAMKFYDFFFSAGGQLYDDERKHCLLNSEAGIEALQLYLDILYKYRYDGFEVEGDFQGFANGTASMFCHGQWVPKSLHEKAPNLNWGVGQIPAKVRSASNGGIYPLVVASDSKEKELAWDFIRFMMLPESFVVYSRNEMITPPVPEAAALPEFRENKVLRSLATQPNVLAVPVVPRMNEIGTMIGAAIEDTARNNKDPKTVLDDLVAKVDKILQEAPPTDEKSLSPEPVAWTLLILAGLVLVGYVGWYWGRERSDKMTYLYMLPFVIYFAIFFVYPIVSSLILSFWDYNPLDRQHPFVGLRNFAECAKDATFRKCIVNTIVYAFWTVVFGVSLSLILAMALNRTMSGVGIYRTLYFLPVVTSIMGATLVWKFIYRADDVGLLNMMLHHFGIKGNLLWTKDEKLAMPCLIAFGVWKSLGFNMLIFLAGLKAIPSIYEEAAAVDGANAWQRFSHVILPTLRPTMLFVVVTSLITAFQVFTQVVGMTEGGPNNATRTIVYQIYEVGFRDFRLGYASAAAVVMLVIVGFITYAQMRLIRE